MKQHDQFERFIGNWLDDYRARGKTVYCRRGCSGCCNMTVHAVYLEAIPIAKRISEQQRKKLSDYIEHLKSILPALTDLKSYLKLNRETMDPCPFLDLQGACSIYPLRPLSCRALLSTRPAAWCTVDFSTLDDWDKQAYEAGLDTQVVAWPTHYVAATQDFARELESSLLDAMHKQSGWALAGNLAAMVWLEDKLQLSQMKITTAEQMHDILAAAGLNHQLLLNFSLAPQNVNI